jgi:prevent-host-death family protein
MPEQKVGIRELKARLSGYIRAMKKGTTIVITERGSEVGRIIPTTSSAEDRMHSLVRSGFADWNGRRLKAGTPAAKLKSGRKTLSEIVSEDRD